MFSDVNPEHLNMHEYVQTLETLESTNTMLVNVNQPETETCYMRQPNVDSTDVIVSLQTCLSHNDESKSNVDSLFALFLVPVWN